MQANSLKPIAIFIPSLSAGGVARVILRLSKAFVKSGKRVDLIVCKKIGEYLPEIPDGIRIVELTPNSTWMGRYLVLTASLKSFSSVIRPILIALKPPKTINYIRALITYLNTQNPEALLAAKTPCNLIALIARRQAKSPTRIVISERTSLSPIIQSKKQWRWRFISPAIQRIYPWADAITAVSQGAAQDLSEISQIPINQITPIFNPINVHDITLQAKDPPNHPWFRNHHPIIVGVGRLVPQKDFSCLLKAFRKVRDQRVARLVILGEGRMREEYEKLSKQLDIEKDLSMPGFVLNPYPYFTRASVFVLSSAWEGWPNALMEALACGCPVVSTDCPSGPAEILQGGHLGKLVSVGDDASMAKAILSTLDNPPDSAQLRARAEEFDIQSISQKYLDLLLN